MTLTSSPAREAEAGSPSRPKRSSKRTFRPPGGSRVTWLTHQRSLRQASLPDQAEALTRRAKTTWRP